MSKSKASRIALGVLVCCVVLVLGFFYFRFNYKSTSPDVKSFWDVAAQTEISAEKIRIDSQIPLSAQMNYDPSAPYILFENRVLKLDNDRLINWYLIPISADDYHIVTLFKGTALFQSKKDGTAKAFNLSTKTEIQLPTGPFTALPIGVNRDGAAVLALKSTNRIASKLVAIDGNGSTLWSYGGECAREVTKYPETVGFVACQNFQSIRQEGGWVLDAATGRANRPALQPGEQIVVVEGEVFILSQDRQSVSRVKWDGSIEDSVPVSPRVVNMVVDGAEDPTRYKWQTYSLTDVLRSGLTPEDIGDRTVLSGGSVVTRVSAAKCKTPVFLDNGAQYMCGLSDNFAKASSFQKGLQVYKTISNTLLWRMDGSGTVLRLNGTLFVVQQEEERSIALVAMNNKRGQLAESGR